MNSTSASTTLLIATRNAHKVGEIRAILGSAFNYRTLNDFTGAPKIVEDANTFAGNATKKAVELARWISETQNLRTDPANFFVLADDSGLEVDALNGAPGVHSARFAALDSGHPENSTDTDNNAKLLRLLAEVPLEKRRARFRCVLALTPVLPKENTNASPVCFVDEADLHTELFDGACEGRIDLAPRGQGGFGYDPLFIPDGFDRSFAELGEEQKNRISHRSQALAKLRSRLESRADFQIGRA
ncbi:MAG TPA: non-canonical purine NTP pyrophosphatase [Verrucomicrobiae bacterium]|nr:non-canonical purine NTP pyrophosphatase [Verrucomicrobiae bacterium]